MFQGAILEYELLSLSVQLTHRLHFLVGAFHMFKQKCNACFRCRRSLVKKQLKWFRSEQHSDVRLFHWIDASQPTVRAPLSSILQGQLMWKNRMQSVTIVKFSELISSFCFFCECADEDFGRFEKRVLATARFSLRIDWQRCSEMR